MVAPRSPSAADPERDAELADADLAYVVRHPQFFSIHHSGPGTLCIRLRGENWFIGGYDDVARRAAQYLRGLPL